MSDKYNIRVYADGTLNRMYREKHLDQAVSYARTMNILETDLKDQLDGMDITDENLPIIDAYCFINKKGKYVIKFPPHLADQLDSYLTTRH